MASGREKKEKGQKNQERADRARLHEGKVMKFPATIHNADGCTYSVDCQEALDYHLGNGWSLEKMPPPVVVDPVKAPDLADLELRVSLLEDALNNSASLDSVKALAEKVTSLENSVNIQQVTGESVAIDTLEDKKVTK